VALQLRADTVDDSGAVEKPNSFSVVGFTCGSQAIVHLDPAKAGTWMIRLRAPGERMQICDARFVDPADALRYLENWVRTMESLAAAKSRPKPETA
jgi:hypothetical protein